MELIIKNDSNVKITICKDEISIVTVVDNDVTNSKLEQNEDSFKRLIDNINKHFDLNKISQKANETSISTVVGDGIKSSSIIQQADGIHTECRI